MTTKVKFKGSKRLERRRAERLTQSRQRASAPSVLSRAQNVNAPSRRHLNNLPTVTSLVGILEKRAKFDGTIFYKDIHWVAPAKDGSAAIATKITEMSKPHLLAAIEFEKDKRIAFTRMAGATFASSTRDMRQSAQKAAAIHCAWLVCLEAEAMRRDPSYLKFLTSKGMTATKPTPSEIAALPSVFVGF